MARFPPEACGLFLSFFIAHTGLFLLSILPSFSFVCFHIASSVVVLFVLLQAPADRPGYVCLFYTDALGSQRGTLNKIVLIFSFCDISKNLRS